MKLRNKPMHLYLSGPMTGIEQFNRPAFDAAAEKLRGVGYIVIVPGDGEDYDSVELAATELSRKKRQYYLSRDIDYIQELADAVVVLPGWEDSEGSKLEVLVAQEIGVPVWSFETGLPIHARIETVVRRDNEL